MKSVAIVGSGIAGMASAYFLSADYAVTVFEKENYTGGHTNTIEVRPFGNESRSVSFDTGFMVFNHVTYPYLTKLFTMLEVPTKKTDMSFSVQYLPDGIEWNGAGLDKVFAQRKNIVSPRFWRMLSKLDWFNKNAPLHLREVSNFSDDSSIVHQTVRDYVDKHNLGEDFLNWYLVPMGASVWSTPPDKMLSFPMAALVRFFHNHGFLGLDTHYQWYTVVGGSKNYVPLLTARYKNAIKHGAEVARVERLPQGQGAEVTTADGVKQVFDKVIFACHADQALAALADPDQREQQLLSPFKYQNNQITVHSDPSIMPSNKLAWASWNYRVAREGGSFRSDGSYAPSLHYWMNSLQGVSDKTDYFVSLNSDDLIAHSLVHKKLQYTHPLFDLQTFKAQSELSSLNTISPDQSIYFCGSYFRNGFHEDALASAVDLASTILGKKVF